MTVRVGLPSTMAVGVVALASPALAQGPAAELVGLPDDEVFDAVRAAVGEADAMPETPAQARRRARRVRGVVEEALRSEGFYAARATAQVRASEPPEAVVMIDPGPRFTLGRVEVEILSDEAPQDALVAARAALDLEPGAPARAGDVLAAEERAVSALAEAGYPDAFAGERAAVVDHARAVMDVTFRLDAGRPAVFGAVENMGPARLRGRYLSRAAPFRAGEPYSRSKVEEFEDLLRDTGAFAGVDVRLADSAPGDGVEERAVIVETRTGQRRTIAVGGSYSTSEGPGVEVEWARRNIFAGAETLTVTAEASQLERRIDLEVAAPHFRRAQRTLRLGSAIENEETDAFDRTAVSARIGFDQPILRRAAIAAGVETSAARLRDAGEEPDEFIQVSLPTAINWEGVDAQLDPQSGVRLGLAATPTIAYSSDTSEYAALTTTMSAYHALVDDALVAAARVRFGAVVGEALADVPADDRLYAGGGGSVRGYEFQGVGPRDADGAPSGGRSLAETSGELRWRMRRSFGMTAFVDGGTAGGDLDPSFDDMQWGAGLGLRYYASFGPLRADIATPLNPRDGDPDLQFYLGVGQSF